MAYVDLNPIRAKMAVPPERSGHTSIKERLKSEFNAEAALNKQFEKGYLFNLHIPVNLYYTLQAI